MLKQEASDTRIAKQFQFLIEVDRLKSVLRANSICDASRRENSAEHSWHIALYALTLAEHANHPVSIERVIKMLLIHDLVEIDAGDTPLHSTHDTSQTMAIEKAAADRIFGLLPEDQCRDFRALWDEFEAAETEDAVFAKAIDRVQPVICNLETDGGTWTDYNVTLEQLETRVGTRVEKGALTVWKHLKSRITTYFS